MLRVDIGYRNYFIHPTGVGVLTKDLCTFGLPEILTVAHTEFMTGFQKFAVLFWSGHGCLYKALISVLGRLNVRGSDCRNNLSSPALFFRFWV